VADIGFYHLTRTSLLAALPPLLGRTLAAGEKALVLCAAEQLSAIDEALWLSQNPDWLPHGTAGMPHTEWQPIFITDVEINPAGAKFLFLTAGSAPADFTVYARVFDLFDGNDEVQVSAARGRWKLAKDSGHALTYWKQGNTGWEKSS
jgi:DNA polymerase III subunit chi